MPAVVTIAVGCLLSRSGVKVCGLTLAYFATAFQVIHYHRPKDAILPPPPKRSEPVRVVPRPRTPPLVVKKLKPKRSPNKSLAKMQAQTHTMQVLNLYRGTGKDSGRCSFAEILAFKETDLEMRPGVVHWLFPAEFRIKGSGRVPMITDELIEAFSNDPDLKAKQKTALIMMLNHFGLKLDDDDSVVKNPENFESKKTHLSGDNFHRITCILSSLYYLGQEELAESFYDCLGVLNQAKEIEADAFLVDCWKPAKEGKTPKMEAAPRPLFPSAPQRPVPVALDGPSREEVRTVVLDFYSGRKKVGERSIDDATSLVWERSPEIIEYMSWIFPIVNARAPIGGPTLDEVTIEKFKTDGSIREKQRAASLHFLTLFGLELDAAGKIGKTAKFEDNLPNLSYAYKERAYQRISPSLRALGNKDLAGALEAFVESLTIKELMRIV